jgi:indole-3-glycerol phosphate synthase
VSILAEIFAHKREEVAARKLAVSESEIEARALARPLPLDFRAALMDASKPRPCLIAEIKQRSPSKGILRENFDPLDLAQTYASQGTAAISVLTDSRYFGGSLERLAAITDLNLGLPLLRKDFIFDSYQLMEARAAGASAALLIVAMLADSDLERLIRQAGEWGLTPLVEVHDSYEYQRALDAGARVIGVNNRDLRDFTVSLDTTFEIVKARQPGTVFVSESGIHSGEDVRRLGEAGVDAILVGEALVTAPEPAAKMAELLGERLR